MKYRITTIYLLCISLCPGYGQYIYDASKVSGACRRIVAGIQKDNQFLGNAISAGGFRPRQYDRFEQLRKQATTAELRELTSHPNGVVRCYAFWALAFDPAIDLLPVLKAHIKDTAKVYTMFGCIASTEKVGDVLIDIATPGFFFTEEDRLDSFQLTQLDSILIYTPNTLNRRERLIYKASPTAALYPVLRKLVAEDRNLVALVPLSKYKKTEDIPLILRSREQNRSTEDGYYYTYEAISNFPHPEFFPLLEKNLQQTWDETHYTNEWIMLYYAIASYKNGQACALLQRSLTQVKTELMRDYHLRFITCAASTYKCPVYDSLLWALWTEEQQIMTNVYEYLQAKEPQRSLEAIKQTLLHTDEYIITQNSEDKNELTPDSMILAMIDRVLQEDRNYGLELIAKNIRETNVHLFALFADKAVALKDPLLAAALLERMAKDDNAPIYLKAAEALITYNDKAINARVGALIQQTPDRYRENDNFRSFLKENDTR